MDPASPTAAGTGQATTSDARSVAFTGSPNFKWDWKFAGTFDSFAAGADGRRVYRGSGHPRATGDGLA